MADTAHTAENDAPRIAPCGTCFASGWYGSRRGRGHLHCDCGRPCIACPIPPGRGDR